MFSSAAADAALCEETGQRECPVRHCFVSLTRRFRSRSSEIQGQKRYGVCVSLVNLMCERLIRGPVEDRSFLFLRVTSVF